MYYIGLDVHKRKISYCVKDGSGQIHAAGSISATRLELDDWMRALPQLLERRVGRVSVGNSRSFSGRSIQQLQAEAKWSCPNAREWLL
jgi:hypothetical protein